MGILLYATATGRNKPPWRNGIRGRLRACARKGVVVRVHSGAPLLMSRPRQSASRSHDLYGVSAQPPEERVCLADYEPGRSLGVVVTHYLAAPRSSAHVSLVVWHRAVY